MKRTVNLSVFFAAIVLLLATNSLFGQTPSIAGAVSPSGKIDGFFGLKFGASVAEARKFIATTKFGKIVEEHSSRSKLAISQAQPDYPFLKDRTIWSDASVVVVMNFVNDKFYAALLYLPEKVADARPSDEWSRIEKELDKLHFKTDEQRYRSEGAETSGTTWRYKHPDGYENIIDFESKQLESSEITFISLKFVDEAAQAEKNLEAAQKFYEAGEKFRTAQKYELAIGDYSSALKLNPEHIDALHYRGHSYNNIGKFDLAAADFEAAIKLDPKAADLLADLLNDHASTFVSRKTNYTAGLAAVNKAIQLKANMAKAYVTRARLHCALGKKAIAAADEETAVGLGATIAEPCK